MCGNKLNAQPVRHISRAYKVYCILLELHSILLLYFDTSLMKLEELCWLQILYFHKQGSLISGQFDQTTSWAIWYYHTATNNKSL